MIQSVFLYWFCLWIWLTLLWGKFHHDVVAFVPNNNSPECFGKHNGAGAEKFCWQSSAIYLSQQKPPPPPTPPRGSIQNSGNQTRSNNNNYSYNNNYNNNNNNNYSDRRRRSNSPSKKASSSFENGRSRTRNGSSPSSPSSSSMYRNNNNNIAANNNNRQKPWKEIIDRSRSNGDIEDWIRRQQRDEKSSYFSKWTTADQINFVKVLQGRRAFKAILYFLDSLKRPSVKVCTTAMFSMALSTHHRHESLGILDLMDRRGVSPTSLTFIALLGSIDGPSAASWMMARFERYKGVKMTAEVYNSAIYACRRRGRDDINNNNNNNNNNSNDWQVALMLLQQMRTKRIQPTTKTFHATLQVLSRTGKVSMAMALIQQMKNTPHLKPDDFVWAAAINVCAQAADYRSAIQVINEMQSAGCQPNLRHCSALIKAFVKSEQGDLALLALQMMTGSSSDDEEVIIEEEDQSHPFRLPKTAPDLIALNTVIAACAKSRNYEGAMSIYQKMKAGEFHDPDSNKVIDPDLVTHHAMLTACSNPKDARQIVKEMRLSRRSRYGAVPPTSVTYTHAINVCQRASKPDLKGAEEYLRWAKADGIKINVFMYSSTIWTAQRSDNWRRALVYFEEMEAAGCEPNDVAYNGVLSALSASGEFSKVMEFYQEMKEKGHQLFAATAKRMVKSLLVLNDVSERQSYLEDIFKLMNAEEKTVRIGGPIFEALIGAYGSQGYFEEALSIFESIEGVIDKACLRSILLSCALCQPAMWEDAVSILHTSDIVSGTTGPGKIDQIALGNAILACCKADQFEEGLNLLQLYGLSSAVTQSEGTPPIPVVAINALISACGRGRRPDLSLATFNDMKSRFGVAPDVRSYRSAVIACNQAEHEKARRRKASPHQIEEDEYETVIKWWECALALLRRMREDGKTPDMKIYSSVISACEAAGEWQRALGVLQMILDEYDTGGGKEVLLNSYCFNAAISACEKGGAWVEALELYERMLDMGGSIKPNYITLSSLIVALDKAGQKELAHSKYVEGRELGIVDPWRWTRTREGSSVYALDLHHFSAAMAKVALRSALDTSLAKQPTEFAGKDLVIITGIGQNRATEPILKSTTLDLLTNEYQLTAKVDPLNPGRVVVDSDTLLQFVKSKSWV